MTDLSILFLELVIKENCSKK